SLNLKMAAATRGGVEPLGAAVFVSAKEAAHAGPRGSAATWAARQDAAGPVGRALSRGESTRRRDHPAQALAAYGVLRRARRPCGARPAAAHDRLSAYCRTAPMHAHETISAAARTRSASQPARRLLVGRQPSVRR